MPEREFIVLAKKGCPSCNRVIKFFEDHSEFKGNIFYADVDFQNKEFKDDFGQDATYPRVYERLTNGKKVFFGDSSQTIEKLKF
jgi:hypothetical protein